MYEIENVNNCTFIFSPFDNLETASFGIFLKIGSRYEKKDLKGIAHFLEHLLFKGSKKYSYRKIKQEIEGRGGILNGFTSQEFTGFYAHFLKKNLAKTVDILIDMVFNPLLKETDIEKERNVILEEIKMYNDLPASRSLALLDKLLWKDHSLGEEIIGHPQTVKKIKKNQLLSFKENFYLPINTVISCAGSFKKQEVLCLIGEKIKRSSKKIYLKTTSPKNLEGINIKVEPKNLQQTHLAIGFRGVSYKSEEKFTIELLNVILGANMSSRLFNEIREKRALCYDISSEAQKYKDCGAFIIHLGLDKTNINKALSAILTQLEKIKQEYVTTDELSRAKDYILGQISMAGEQPQGRMFYSAENFITLGKIYTPDEIKSKLESISKLEINKLAQKIFDFKNICISCVGEVKTDTKIQLEKIVKKFAN
ncbi:MAG: insulinase family protein [Candidatus Omnitrophica bacterium]|nr:insulinase family protein [Candidatus Omnitrophota bacterium]MCM8830800.1 insulinase family protein [Candidatus Omnitrophota bacterium]